MVKLANAGKGSLEKALGKNKIFCYLVPFNVRERNYVSTSS